MKVTLKGKFDGNIETLPHGEHMPGAVKFNEPDDPKKLGAFVNKIALVITIVTLALFFWRGGIKSFSILGSLVAVVSAYPHEYLHALCFKEEAFIYSDMKHGILFVVGPETMSRRRFVLMSMFPNLVFGIIPFILFLIFPQFGFIGTLGALAIGMGAGDYYNVYNAMKQMPKGARTYLYKFNSYWYMP